MMCGLNVLKALAWKEIRTWGGTAVLLLTLPPVAVSAASLFPPLSLARGALMAGLALVFALLLVSWAVARPSSQKNAGEYADVNLPVRPVVRWALTFFLPLLIVGALGAWYGLWQQVWKHWQKFDYIIDASELWAAAVQSQFVLISMMVFATTFFLNAVISRWLAFLVGLYLAIGTFTVLTFEVGGATSFSSLLWLIIAGLLLGTVLFDVLLRKRPMRTRQGVALLALAAACGAAYLMDSGNRSPQGRYLYYQARRIDSSDWSRSVAPARHNASTWSRILEYRDFRSGATVLRPFEGAAAPLDFLDDDKVILAVQRPYKTDIRIQEWDTSANRVRTLATVPSHRWAFMSNPGRFARGFVRPDGRYLLLSLASTAGDGRDLWIIDLSSGQARLAVPNAVYATDAVRWVGGRAYLYGDGRAVRVNIASGRGEVIRASAAGVEL